MAAILAEYSPRLIRYATRLLDGEFGADDIVQEALVRLWERRDELRPAQPLLPYLYRIVRNLCVDERRKRDIRERPVVAARRHVPTPHEQLEVAELRALAERAIASLPPRRREVFLLAHVHSLSYREIGEVLGLSSQTVANHVSAALGDLRQLLGPLLDKPATRESPSGTPLARISR